MRRAWLTNVFTLFDLERTPSAGPIEALLTGILSSQVIQACKVYRAPESEEVKSVGPHSIEGGTTEGQQPER